VSLDRGVMKIEAGAFDRHVNKPEWGSAKWTDHAVRRVWQDWSPQDSVETLSLVSRFELIGAHAGQIAVTARGIVERINVVRRSGRT
jgi:hypothetical protein